MRKFLFLFSLSIVCLLKSQIATASNLNKDTSIRRVISTFMDCIVHHDSVKFYSLFHTDPVTWVGVFDEASQAAELKKNPQDTLNSFHSNYKSFYRSLSKKGFDEEKFYNIFIQQNDVVATVIFDYSFWHEGKKQNWGKETWGLIKANGTWKITSVIFSLEMENVKPEPKTNRAKY